MTFLRPLFAALAAALFTAVVHAQAPAAPPPKASAPTPKPVAAGASPARLEHCERLAGERTGDARKNYLQACAKTGGAQQSKMKECNVAAKGKKGDERRAFMSDCLRSKKK